MLESEWSRTARSVTCAGCPAAEGSCVLRGQQEQGPDYHLIILLESPDLWANQTGQVIGSEIRTTLRLAADRVSQMLGGIQLKYSVMYACASLEFRRKEPSSGALKSCAPYMEAKLVESSRRLRARAPGARSVILALGPGSMKALQVPVKTHKEARGRVFSINIQSCDYTVVPTVSPRALFTNPNMLDLLILDMKTAVQSLFENSAGCDLATLSKDYFIPSTIQEVRELTERVLSYGGPDGRDPNHWAIAIDTETTSLKPYAPDFKAIMLCLSWGEGEAGVIVLDHKETVYDPVEAKRLAGLITASPKPKILHNGKFDLSVCQRAGMPVNNMWWDTMLGHHWINESVVGFYGLKVLTIEYDPRFAGYEDALHKALVEAVNSRNYVEYQGILSLLQSRSEDMDVACMLEDKAVVLPNGSPVLLSAAEQMYCDLTLKLVDKSLDTEEKQELRKQRNDVRGAITKAYRSMRWPTPAAAKVSHPPDFDPSAGNYEEIPLSILSQYGAIDADITRRIAKKQLERVQKTAPRLLPYYKSVMKNQYVPATVTLARMERRGLKLDKDLLEKYQTEITALRDVMEQRLRNILCDGEVNLQSGQQLGAVISKRFDLPDRLLEYNEDGSLKIDAAFRQKLKKEGDRVLAELAYCLTLFGQANKALGTYLGSWQRFAADDGRIHARFNLNGTATGRLSASDPNLQNVPGTLCACKFTMPDGSGGTTLIESSPGWKIKALLIPDVAKDVIDIGEVPALQSDDRLVFFNLDIASAEVRVLCAYLPPEDPMVEAVRKGLNVPSFMTSKIFALDYDYVEEVKDNDLDIAFKRTACKRVLYGLLYGQGTEGSVVQIYGYVDEDPDKKQAQLDFAKSIEVMLFEMSPGTRAYIEDTKREVDTHGQVLSMFGRVRRFPMISVDRQNRARAHRQAVNFKIQSTASDLLVSQMAQLDAPLREELGGELLLTVHDSIAGQIPLRSLPKMREFFDKWIVEGIKKRYSWLPVEYQYDVSVGPSYGSQIPLDVALRASEINDGPHMKALIAMGLKEST